MKGNYAPAEVERVDVFGLLDKLEELPERARHLPFNTLLNFNQEQFYYLVLKIRANLPREMKQAAKVARDSERIVEQAEDVASERVESGRMAAEQLLDEARAEGERVVATARAQAAQLVQQSEVHRMATAQAHEIVRNAEVEASEIRKGADDYARDLLANLEGVLGKALTTVKRGRESLDEARA